MMKPQFVLVLLFVFCFQFFSHAQFGKFGKVLQKAEELIQEKAAETDPYELKSFNYAIAFLDKSESFENRQKGERLVKAAILLTKEEEQVTPRDEAKEMYELAKNAYLRRQYKLAKASLNMAIDDFEALGDDEDPMYIKSKSLFGLIYSDLAQYSKALSFTEEAVKAWESSQGTESKAYASEMNNLAVLLFNKGEYLEAEQKMSLAVKLVGSSEGENSMPYAIALNNYSILNQFLGRSDQALDLINQAIAIADKNIREKSGTFLQLLTNKALILQYSGDFDAAETAYKNALELQTSRFKINRGSDPDYAHMLTNLASLYMNQQKWDEAMALMKESLGIFEGKFGESHTLTAGAQRDLANAYRITGDLANAENYLNKSLSTFQYRLGENHPKTVQAKEDLATIHWLKGEIDQADSLYQVTIANSIDYINRFFASMSEAEKSSYWSQSKPRFDTYFNFAFANAEKKPELLDNAMNYRLKTKGLLLNSSSKIKQAILNSGDAALVGLYQDWVDQKKSLAVYYGYSQEDLAEEEINIEDLERNANDLEKQLSSKVSGFGQSFIDDKISVDIVSDALANDQVVVEVFHLPVFDGYLTDKNQYVAVAIHSDKMSYEVLADGDLMDTKYLNAYTNLIRLKMADKMSYQKYWQPILPLVGGASEIFFSPDGVYNQINVNTLLSPEGKYVLESQQIKLIGSPVDIVASSKTATISKTAFLLGFPTYGDDKIAPLPGTEVEIAAVKSTLQSAKYGVEVFVGQQASESEVKKVNSPQIMHIATHGFFMQNVADGGAVFGVPAEHAQNNPLLRAGLILAGGSEDGESALGTDDNGVLTAYEAMNLSLDNTSLVVLSACETGKGDVQSGEGVYGLQRAFTVAGADKILMSLWKVNDAATRQLMQLFYQNWAGNGVDPIEAFRDAQLTLMKDFAEPYYWGAFVMVN